MKESTTPTERLDTEDEPIGFSYFHVDENAPNASTARTRGSFGSVYLPTLKSLIQVVKRCSLLGFSGRNRPVHLIPVMDEVVAENLVVYKSENSKEQVDIECTRIEKELGLEPGSALPIIPKNDKKHNGTFILFCVNAEQAGTVLKTKDLLVNKAPWFQFMIQHIIILRRNIDKT